MANTDLMSALVISGVTFSIDYGQESSGQAGGQTRVKDLRSPLWRMKADCSTLTLDQLRRVRAIVGALGGSLGSFYAWDPAAQFPAADPDGAILGASNVLISGLGAGAKNLLLKGLPAGYVLTVGDMVSFDYGTSRALHQVVTPSVVANGSGVTPEFEIHPPRRQGAAVNNVVSLKRPSAEMRIVAGSLNLSADGMIGQAGFEAVQVI
ncbi:hypothetical protein [Kaistia terrae]|uniref:Phage tail protein n=1 Tax=Kaistia terrae TaxID=537017 RepID=A0ABW0Q3J4_9HYPH|nr:hypothetical protein [Kaistia terrae]MCX5581320.1 hypothetical protein [Kaistia terrae]